MPIISRMIKQLRPSVLSSNLASFNNNQSAQFSQVRTVMTPQYQGTILPPTQTQFINAWSRHNPNYILTCSGETLEEMKQSLRLCNFSSNFLSVSSIGTRSYNNLKALTWTRMVMAFNLYSIVKGALDIEFFDPKVDFITTCMNHGLNKTYWERRFRIRSVLFIPNEKLHNLIYLTEINNINEFWDHIFELYDNLFFVHSQTRPNFVRSSSSTRRNINVRRRMQNNVNNPNHSVAIEYLNRDIDDEINVISNNQQAAMIIRQINTMLPIELRKAIYETCMALHISHPN